MSLFGEAILNRINSNSGLSNPINPAYNVINNTVGEWLDNFDLMELYDGVFIQSAKDKYLNLFGHDYNILRKPDEEDENYRNRIIYESLSHLTVDYLLKIYDLQLYTYIENYNPSSNKLTSDNPYITKNGFMTYANTEIQNILKKKFVVGEGLHWLTP